LFQKLFFNYPERTTLLSASIADSIKTFFFQTNLAFEKQLSIEKLIYLSMNTNATSAAPLGYFTLNLS